MAAKTYSVLITGANRGLGLEMVKQMVEATSRPIRKLFACCRDPDGPRSEVRIVLCASMLSVRMFSNSKTISPMCYYRPCKPWQRSTLTSSQSSVLVKELCSSLGYRPIKSFNSPSVKPPVGPAMRCTSGYKKVTQCSSVYRSVWY